MYSAICRSPAESPPAGTKTFDRNASGKTVVNATPPTASGERTDVPSSIPHHSIANEKQPSSATPAATCAASVWIRQPTATPVATITAPASALAARLASRWPVRNAERAIGRVRKRSTIPS